MNKLTALLILPFILMCSPVQAAGGEEHSHGDGHSHSHGPINEAAAIKKAQTKVTALIEEGKIEQSWNQVSDIKASQQDFGKGNEWVIKLFNKALEGTGKENLYIFYTLDGNYLATNYTGK